MGLKCTLCTGRCTRIFRALILMMQIGDMRENLFCEI